MEPVIKFKGYSIEKLIYTKEDFVFSEEKDQNVEIQNGIALSISVECGVTDDLKRGKVSLNIKSKHEDSNLSIVLDVDGYFDINGINELTEIENFLLVNGTAILYPYLRSIISMVSSLDSNEAIVLPTINTSNFAN